MRVLRSSMFSPALEPMTVVIRDSDVIDTLDSIRAGAKDEAPHYFVAHDIFETEDGSIEKAAAFAMIRMEERADDERNMALQFYWATAQFQLLSGDGTLIMPEPAPLTPEQIRVVFEQIVEHPDYDHQSVQATAKDGTVVTIENGEVK
jgi:hypothetical protein